MRKITLVLAAMVATASALTAQQRRPIAEIRPFVGASIPTGDQRDLFTDAPLFGLQAAVQMKPNFHLVGALTWVPSEEKYQFARDNVHILQYDLGAELSFIRPFGGGWQMRPFVGIGGGARTYLYQAATLSDKTCALFYGALGTELQLGRTALRLEARDNVFCYKSPVAGVESQTRNDVGIALGVSYHFR
ncbi:MAG TPA: hypothetical protein VF252_10870 [Gemmatimonadales bacterium]